MSEFIYLYRGGDANQSPEQMQKSMERWNTWLKDLAAKGHVKDAGQPLDRAGKLVKGKSKGVTDGPYAETKEQMGGFWIIDVPDLDAALEWAAKCSAACERPIEVRPADG